MSSHQPVKNMPLRCTCSAYFPTRAGLDSHIGEYLALKKSLEAQLQTLRSFGAHSRADSDNDSDSEDDPDACEDAVRRGIWPDGGVKLNYCPHENCDRSFKAGKKLRRHFEQHVECNEVCVLCHQRLNRVRDYLRHVSDHQNDGSVIKDDESVIKVRFMNGMCEALQKRADEQRLKEQRLVESRRALKRARHDTDVDPYAVDTSHKHHHYLPSTKFQYNLRPELDKSRKNSPEDAAAVNSQHIVSSCSQRTAQVPNLRGAGQPEGEGGLVRMSPYSTAIPNHLGDHEGENRSQNPQIMSATRMGSVSREGGDSGYRTAPPPMAHPVYRCLPEDGRPEIRSGSQYYESVNQTTPILHAPSNQPYSLSLPPQPGYADWAGHPGNVTPNTGATNIAHNLRMLPALKSDGAGHTHTDHFNSKTNRSNNGLRLTFPIMVRIKLEHYLGFLRDNFGDDGSLPTYLLGSINFLQLETTSKVKDYCAAVTTLCGSKDIIMEKLTDQEPKLKSGEMIIAQPSLEDFMILGSYVQKRRKARDAAS